MAIAAPVQMKFLKCTNFTDLFVYVINSCQLYLYMSIGKIALKGTQIHYEHY